MVEVGLLQPYSRPKELALLDGESHLSVDDFSQRSSQSQVAVKSDCCGGCFCDTDKAIRRDIVRIMTPLRPPSSSLEELVTHADLLRAADQDFLVANFQLFGLGEDIDFL